MKTLNMFMSYFIEHKGYTVASFFYAVSYSHLSPTLHSLLKLQDSRAVVRIFIALLRFSVDSPSYFRP